ncbi:MAG TPA: hypothetical protein VHB73_03730, partial [Alphaproteobacteria bacterium]|nr:hypothetical protein [Alphaproteobacteria bacterium]
NKPLRDGLLGLMVGAFIVTLPWFVEFLHHTIYKNIGGSYQTPTCSASGAAGAGDIAGLDVMLANFVNNIKNPIIAIISLMAIIFGTAMIFWNMIRLSKFGADARSNNLTPILGNLIIGALLVAAGQTLNVSLATLFGNDVAQGTLARYSSLAYNPGGGMDMEKVNRALSAVFDFLYIVGALSFVRGFFILRNVLDGQGQATRGQAFTHIIAGTLLVNMPGFIHVVQNTLGVKIIT